MKQLHRQDLFSWSVFDQERNLDFHSVLWVRDAGNVLIDPLPLSAHDAAHLQQLGGAATIVITNSDHIRAAEQISQQTGALIVGPSAEQDSFAIPCQRWLSDGEEVVSGLIAYQLEGSKTPGELALLLEDSTLITGDLVRCHAGGSLCLLPDAKLSNRQLALQSLNKLAALPDIETVLPGDGWPVFGNGGLALVALQQSLLD